MLGRRHALLYANALPLYKGSRPIIRYGTALAPCPTFLTNTESAIGADRTDSSGKLILVSAITARQLLDALRAEVPELGPVINDHIAMFGEVLPHVLIGDVTRFVVAAHSEGRSEVEDRCLRLLDRALRQGDDDVVNLVAVSFVENTAPWEEATRIWATSWPSGLREEAERQTQ